MRTIEISDRAFAFLQENAEPLIDTPTSALDKIIDKFAKLQAQAPAPSPSTSDSWIFREPNFPSVKHSNPIGAEIAGEKVNQSTWQLVLAEVMNHCSHKGASNEEILKYARVKVKTGAKTYPVDQMAIRFGGLDAERAFRYIRALSRRFRLAITIDILWKEIDGAQFPGKSSTLIIG